MILACSIISSAKGIGKFVFYKLVSGKYIILIYLISFIIWIQFGVEWGSRVNGINYESFMRYEPFAVVFSLPIGLIVFIACQFIPIENMYIAAFVLWIAYFISFYFQLFFFIRYLQKKRGKEWGR
jgi:hypothetical protein